MTSQQLTYLLQGAGGTLLLSCLTFVFAGLLGLAVALARVSPHGSEGFIDRMNEKAIDKLLSIAILLKFSLPERFPSAYRSAQRRFFRALPD